MKTTPSPAPLDDGGYIYDRGYIYDIDCPGYNYIEYGDYIKDGGKEATIPEGEEPKSAAEIVDDVLKTEVKQSTFFRNIRLQLSKNNSSQASDVVAAHVIDLQENLERSEIQDEVMKEELAAIKMKSEEADAAGEKEFELLHKECEERDEKLAHLMALFGAKAV
ncbi:hypothetical protein D1007_06668 [Hordeum vulgare]|nr:hypothetical protein D1007_06668 [Hordeum vulgare]